MMKITSLHLTKNRQNIALGILGFLACVALGILIFYSGLHPDLFPVSKVNPNALIAIVDDAGLTQPSRFICAIAMWGMAVYVLITNIFDIQFKQN